jgi:hypothetical protein
MRTTMKMMLAVMGVAVLASPAMAQTWWDAKVPLSTNNALWGLAYGPAYPAYGPAYPAYGSAVPFTAGRRGPGFVAVAPPLPRILDCVHVTFPQCSGGGL